MSNTGQKKNEARDAAIVAAYRAGTASPAQLARRHGLTQGRISQIVNAAEPVEVPKYKGMPPAIPDAEEWRDEVKRLEGKVARLTDLLYVADAIIMQVHGCFPSDRSTPEQRFLHHGTKAIRDVTGNDYEARKKRAQKAYDMILTNGYDLPPRPEPKEGNGFSRAMRRLKRRSYARRGNE